MDYFKKLLDLLKIEREADQQQYQKLTENSSLSERRTNGLAWYPVAIRGSEMSRGDYIIVELERTTHHDIFHQLRFGAPVVFFTNHDPKKDRVEGIISHQSANRVKITLRTDELPDWSRDGKLGVELLFDDNTYDEMQEALKNASQNTNNLPLVNILTGEKSPSFNSEIPLVNVPSLNSSQQNSLDNILTANELSIIHGPPGTGKTTTLIAAIDALSKQEKNRNTPILVVAPSNAAVDLLTEKLSEKGLNVLRIGNPVRVSEHLMALTLDSKMAEHKRLKEAKELKKQANEYKNMAHKYKRNFGKAERDQRKALFDEAHKIMKEVDKIEQYIIEDLVSKAQVITATLVGANHYTIRNLKYNVAVIDEAGQALEPAMWIPILKTQKLILAGDHCQLSPTIKSQNSELSLTLLEKCVDLHPEAVTLLEEQYRMNEAIMGYSSKVFYHNKLRANAKVANQVLFSGDSPLLFLDTAGCGFDEKLEGTSSTNPDEAVLLLKHLCQLVSELKSYYSLENFPTIAIISPYKQQISLLNELFKHSPELQLYKNKISVNTIDSFQGQERDIVYISMTRSNAEGEIGFLSDIRRMNVAMTRARKKLVVVGDSATLSTLPFYYDFLAYCEKMNAYQSAWELHEN